MILSKVAISIMLPDPAPKVVFLGDGEFDGTKLQSTLNEWGWRYVCRTANNIKIFLDGEEFETSILSQLLPPGSYKRNGIQLRNALIHLRNCHFLLKI